MSGRSFVGRACPRLRSVRYFLCLRDEAIAGKPTPTVSELPLGVEVTIATTVYI
jgi:hypothetical protein